MTVAGGLQSQVGFSPETTHGTRVAPATFLPFVNEGIEHTIERIESKGRRAGRRIASTWRSGREWVAGPIAFELAPQSLDKLLKWAMGAVGATTGTGPYTRVFTPGTLDDEYMTFQVNRPDESGTDRPFDYTGCQCTDWEIAVRTGTDMAMFTPRLYGQAEDTSQTLATATYPSSWMPFAYVSGQLSIGGSAVDFDEISIRGDNALATGRHAARATTPAKPKKSLEEGERVYSGQLSQDFFSLTQYNRFVNGTEAALSMLFTDGASASLTIAGNVRFDGTTPKVPGPRLIKQPVPFRFGGVGATTDAAAITITLVNSDA